jgi:adenylate cyclase
MTPPVACPRVIMLVRMRDLIGAEVFVNLLVGRYHRPVEEERIFLFVASA